MKSRPHNFKKPHRMRKSELSSAGKRTKTPFPPQRRKHRTLPEDFVKVAIREAVIMFREMEKKEKKERREELNTWILKTKEFSDKSYGTEFGFHNAIKHTVLTNIVDWAKDPEKAEPDNMRLGLLRKQLLEVRRLKGRYTDLDPKIFMKYVKDALEEIK